MSVYEEKIWRTVVVIIKESDAPATQELSSGRDFSGLVGKREVFLIGIKAEKFAIDIRDEQILPPVPIVINSVDTHAGTGFARVAISDPGGQADLLELSVAFVDEEKIGHRIVRHEQIHQPIVVDIRSDSAERLSGMIRDPGLLADISESAVPIVVEKMAGCGLEETRNTI